MGIYVHEEFGDVNRTVISFFTDHCITMYSKKSSLNDKRKSVLSFFLMDNSRHSKVIGKTNGVKLLIIASIDKLKNDGLKPIVTIIYNEEQKIRSFFLNECRTFILMLDDLEFLSNARIDFFRVLKLVESELERDLEKSDKIKYLYEKELTNIFSRYSIY